MIARLNDECFFRDARLTPQDPRPHGRGYIQHNAQEAEELARLAHQASQDCYALARLAGKIGRQICAGLCSAILPGAGQFYLGQASRDRYALASHIFFGCFFLGLAIAAWIFLPIGFIVLIHVMAALHAGFTS